MNRTKTQAHRLVPALCALAAAGLGVSAGIRLDGFDVPLSLTVACAMSVTASALLLLLRIAEAWSVTAHRCTAPGCDFSVRLRHTDAAESRRWQEIAATHPGHDQAQRTP